MDARIDDVLDRLGITHLADREPFSLSGGEQQRVGIASILAMGPRLLVLDEPTAQLDPAGTAKVSAILADLAATGTAILCVEHDPRCWPSFAGGRARRWPARRDRNGRRRPGAGAGRVGLATAPGPAGRVGGVLAASAFDVAAVGAGLAALPPDRLDGAGRRHREASAAVAMPAPGGGRPVVELDGLPSLQERGRGRPRVALRIGPGEAVAIVGQNGSGKTTLVKHLDGLLPADLRPRSGSTALHGRHVDRPARRHGGFRVPGSG